jgi:hypothetical protein
VTVGIGVALAMWRLVDVAAGDPERTADFAMLLSEFLAGAIFNTMTAFFILFPTLVADERVARGVGRLPAYLCAVAIGSAVGAVMQSETYEWLQLRTNLDTSVRALFFDNVIWGSIIVFLYVNRRGALLAAAQSSAAQIQRADAQRRTFESRLQALQARVEPQFLFSTLTQVRDLYDSAPEQGSEMLADLIVYLRAALPHLRRSSSTLGQEMELAIAYFNIMRIRLGVDVALDVNVPEATRSVPVSPMLVLPLLEHVLIRRVGAQASSGIVHVRAHFVAGRLRLEIEDGSLALDLNSSSDALHTIEERLQALYGDDAVLVLERSGVDSTLVALEIPHGWTHGDTR